MSLFDYGIAIIIALILLIVVVEVLVVCVVAGYIATLLGATGLVWWCIAIVVFILINSVIGALGSIV